MTTRGRQSGGVPAGGPPPSPEQPRPVFAGPDTILRGIVGSTAYGLAREGSDVDRLGVFVAPTVRIAGLHWHSRHESRVSHDPDIAEHEVGKFLRLALKGNPTILELLYLPDASYDVRTDLGDGLRQLRPHLLSERAIRSAYGGYAHQQAHRLQQRGDGSFSSNTRQRTVKHARHLLRLLRHGRQLLETGDLIVHVGDPADYFAFDRMTPEQMIEVYQREADLFENTVSVLPAEPDEAAVSAWLSTVRRTHLSDWPEA